MDALLIIGAVIFVFLLIRSSFIEEPNTDDTEMMRYIEEQEAEIKSKK